MIVWTKTSVERPVSGCWRLKGFATINVAGFPVQTRIGTFVTGAEFKRLDDYEDYEPAIYTELYYDANSKLLRMQHALWKIKPDDILFVDEKTHLIYPEKNIIAWMPFPKPYKLQKNEHLCCTCSRLFYDVREVSKCLECEERFQKIKECTDAIFDVLQEIEDE